MKKKFLVYILTLFLITIIPSISFSQGSLEEGIAKLSQQIASKASQQHKTTIAVIEFSDLQGNVTDLGRFLAEELITRLYSTEKFKVIERLLLNRVISEQKLNLSGMVDPKSAKELGKLLGVDAIVSGTLTDLVKVLRVNARLISTQSGEIFAVASTEITKDESVLKLMNKEDETTETSKLPQSRLTTQSSKKDSDKNIYSQGFTFQLINCKRSFGSIITCEVLITNVESDPKLSLFARGVEKSWTFAQDGASRLFDSQGNEYHAKTVQLGNSVSEFQVEKLLVSGVPTKAIIKFDNVTDDNGPFALDIGCVTDYWKLGVWRVHFKNIEMGK